MRDDTRFEFTFENNIPNTAAALAACQSLGVTPSVVAISDRVLLMIPITPECDPCGFAREYKSKLSCIESSGDSAKFMDVINSDEIAKTLINYGNRLMYEDPRMAAKLLDLGAFVWLNRVIVDERVSIFAS